MMTTIKTVSEYMDEIKKFSECKREADTIFFYRGEDKDNAHALLPTALTPDYEAKEDEIYNKVMVECAQEFDGLSSHIEILSKMQHYGVPTRANALKIR